MIMMCAVPLCAKTKLFSKTVCTTVPLLRRYEVKPAIVIYDSGGKEPAFVRHSPWAGMMYQCQ